MVRRPTTENSERGTRLAVWQAPLFGLTWIDSLVEAGEAIAPGGNGYPSLFTAEARHLIPKILAGPPLTNQQ